MSLIGRDDHRNALEFGCYGLGIRSLAHHRIAQRDVDLARTAHRSEDDTALNADFDTHRITLHRALARGLAERKLVAKVAGGRGAGLRGDI